MKKLFSVFAFCFSCILSGCAQEMQLHDDMVLLYLVKTPTTKAAKPPVIILMHGYGSNERDMFELRHNLPANFIVISVRAPYEVGPNSYQWYEMIKVNGKNEGKKATLEHSQGLITQFISQVTEKYKTDANHVFLSGFSQGGMMSYYAGLTAPEKLRGIAPLSGMIFESLKEKVKVTPALKKLNIYISNGTNDDRISFEDGKASNEYLTKLGLKPEFHAYPEMGHQITKNVLDDLVSWLNKCLPEKKGK